MPFLITVFIIDVNKIFCEWIQTSKINLEQYKRLTVYKSQVKKMIKYLSNNFLDEIKLYEIIRDKPDQVLKGYL